MRLVILGGPGSGKGTQGKQLCHELGIPWISTGDIFRAAIAQSSELGIKAAPYVEQGELVPDSVAIELIRERLVQSDTENGWLLDGYPRTAFQAEELDFLLDDLGKRLNWAIWLDVPEPILIDRSLGRSRQDDRPDIIRRRIELFHERTIPIMEYYEPRGRLLKIDGNQPAEAVHRDILKALIVDS
ncbi:MAG: adenylate kinase [Geitlerinemataceae cyanobacterium]